MDLKIPPKKQEIIEETEKKVKKIQKNYQAGVLTEGERYNQVIDAWTHARVAVTNEMMRGLRKIRTRRQAISEPDLPYERFRRKRQC